MASFVAGILTILLHVNAEQRGARPVSNSRAATANAFRLRRGATRRTIVPMVPTRETVVSLENCVV